MKNYYNNMIMSVTICFDRLGRLLAYVPLSPSPWVHGLRRISLTRSKEVNQITGLGWQFVVKLKNITRLTRPRQSKSPTNQRPLLVSLFVCLFIRSFVRLYRIKTLFNHGNCSITMSILIASDLGI
jgi:hypothetical protein